MVNPYAQQLLHSRGSLGRANQRALMKAARNQQRKLTLLVALRAFIIPVIKERALQRMQEALKWTEHRDVLQ